MLMDVTDSTHVDGRHRLHTRWWTHRLHTRWWMLQTPHALMDITDSTYVDGSHRLHTRWWTSQTPHMLMEVTDSTHIDGRHRLHTRWWMSQTPHTLMDVTDSTHVDGSHRLHTYWWKSQTPHMLMDVTDSTHVDGLTDSTHVDERHRLHTCWWKSQTPHTLMEVTDSSHVDGSHRYHTCWRTSQTPHTLMDVTDSTHVDGRHRHHTHWWTSQTPHTLMDVTDSTHVDGSHILYILWWTSQTPHTLMDVTDSTHLLWESGFLCWTISRNFIIFALCSIWSWRQPLCCPGMERWKSVFVSFFKFFSVPLWNMATPLVTPRGIQRKKWNTSCLMSLLRYRSIYPRGGYTHRVQCTDLWSENCWCQSLFLCRSRRSLTSTTCACHCEILSAIIPSVRSIWRHDHPCQKDDHLVAIGYSQDEAKSGAGLPSEACKLPITPSWNLAPELILKFLRTLWHMVALTWSLKLMSAKQWPGSWVFVVVRALEMSCDGGGIWWFKTAWASS